MSNGHGALDLCGERKGGKKVIDMEYMFSKILTPSNVGKMNHVLIPRQCAEGCFPKISEAKSGGDDDFLNFEYFPTVLIWLFRFCLCNNRKNYVLTKGWQVFIKEKNLKKGDILSFYHDVGKTTSPNHMFIHIKPHTSTMSLPHRVPSLIFSPSSLMIDDRVHESLGFRTSHGIVPASMPLSFGSGELMPLANLMTRQTTFPKLASPEIVREEKHLRLFGVDINIPNHDYVDESCSGLDKNAASMVLNNLDE
ncbi:B3 domain-containing transcription factor NGA1-like [Miscanthus floridulus]|uniref:B3 domain-containing transcription factor NGA1-like n=1 Tax=Miscanthus floridulus TaxID=154761 RepID=UPI00345A7BB9